MRIPYRWRRKLRGLTSFPVRLALFALLVAAGLYLADRHVPRQHLPWRALDIRAPTGFATDIQLLRLSLSPSSTCAKLIEDAADYKTRVAKAHRPMDPCGWDIARGVYGSDAAILEPTNLTLQCPLAVGTYIWMREIDEAAAKHLGTGVKTLSHAGGYSCRRQVGNSSGQWSEHAYANALDVMGFELDDGRVISVLKDWNGDKDRKRFLRDVRKQACKIFRVTLSPDFNAAHADHFHVDMGPTTSCR